MMDVLWYLVVKIIYLFIYLPNQITVKEVHIELLLSQPNDCRKFHSADCDKIRIVLSARSHQPISQIEVSLSIDQRARQNLGRVFALSIFKVAPQQVIIRQAHCEIECAS